MNFPAPAVRPSLERLVQNLDRDAVRSKRLIRQFAEEDRSGFVREALRILQQDLESPGAQHLVAVIVSEGLLLSTLSDPGLDQQHAIAIARAAARLDPTVDVTLARTLAESAGSSDLNTSSEQHVRLMEVLQAISDGVRIFPSLVRLLRHPNAHLRSKAVLMIGRGNRSAKWLRMRLTDSDARIRANAAEALWAVNDPDARDLLFQLVHDANNRVAGNALLGLYRLGEPSVIPEILAMTRHNAAMFRATAAWVMGETHDPRFAEAAAGLLRETNSVVRKRAFSAVANIRSAVAQAAHGPHWRLTARFIDPESGKPGRRIVLGIAGENGAACPSLLPTDFLVSEDGEAVLRYRVIERPLAETVTVVFVVPRADASCPLPCLAWKRPSDLWAILRYVPDTVAPPLSAPLRFHSGSEAIAAELDRVLPSADCADVWRTLAKAVDPAASTLPAKRNVIVFTDSTDRHAPGEELRNAVLAGQAYVQVISPGPDARIEEFCRLINGAFRIASPESTLDAYLSLFRQYEILYQPVRPDALSVRVRVFRPGVCAETILTPNPSPAGP